MDWLRRFKFGSRLGLLLAVCALGLLAYGGWTFYAMQKVGVSGPLSPRIKLSQQLVSDLLPPPEFIIESYLTCVQLTSGNGGYTPGVLVDRLKRLQQEYETRHQVWQEVHWSPELAAALQRAHQPAKAFFAKVNAEFLPAIYLNDRTRSARILAELTPLYESQRVAMSQVVELAQRKAVDNEAQALPAVDSARLLLVVIVVSSLALAIVLAGLIPRIQDYLFKIRQSGEHLLGSIYEMLDFSKMESGPLDVERVPFELEAVIDNVLKLVSEMAESKGLELLCQIDPELPKQLLGDPLTHRSGVDQIHQQRGEIHPGRRGTHRHFCAGARRPGVATAFFCVRHRHRPERGAAVAAVPRLRAGR